MAVGGGDNHHEHRESDLCFLGIDPLDRSPKAGERLADLLRWPKPDVALLAQALEIILNQAVATGAFPLPAILVDEGVLRIVILPRLEAAVVHRPRLAKRGGVRQAK